MFVVECHTGQPIRISGAIELVVLEVADGETGFKILAVAGLDASSRD